MGELFTSDSLILSHTDTHAFYVIKKNNIKCRYSYKNNQKSKGLKTKCVNFFSTAKTAGERGGADSIGRSSSRIGSSALAREARNGSQESACR